MLLALVNAIRMGQPENPTWPSAGWKTIWADKMSQADQPQQMLIRVAIALGADLV